MRRLAVAVVLAACTHPVTVTPSAPDERLRVTEPVLFHLDKGARTPVPDHGTLHSGDVIAFELATSQLAYVYVLQRHDNGAVDVIMPGPGEGLIAIEPQKTVTLPGPAQDYDIALDDVIGDDTIYVVVSRHPLKIAIDDAIEVGAEPPPKPMVADPTPALPPAPEPEPPPPPVTTAKPARTAARPLVAPATPSTVSVLAHATGFRKKGVERKPKHGEKFQLTVEAPDTDDVIVRAIHFRHVAR